VLQQCSTYRHGQLVPQLLHQCCAADCVVFACCQLCRLQASQGKRQHIQEEGWIGAYKHGSAPRAQVCTRTGLAASGGTLLLMIKVHFPCH